MERVKFMSEGYTIHLVDLKTHEQDRFVDQIIQLGGRVTYYMRLFNDKNVRIYVDGNLPENFESLISLPNNCTCSIGQEPGILATKENIEEFNSVHGILFQLRRPNDTFTDVFGLVDRKKQGTLELEYIDFLLSESVSPGDTLFEKTVGELAVTAVEPQFDHGTAYVNRAYVNCLITPYDTVEHKFSQK